MAETKVGQNGKSQELHLQLQESLLLWKILPERIIGGKTRCCQRILGAPVAAAREACIFTLATTAVGTRQSIQAGTRPSIKAGIMESLGAPKVLVGTRVATRMESGPRSTTAGMIAIRAKIIHGALPSTAWTAKMLRNLRPTMVISPSGCSGDPLSLDSSGARTPGGRRSSRELKSTKVR